MSIFKTLILVALVAVSANIHANAVVPPLAAASAPTLSAAAEARDSVMEVCLKIKKLRDTAKSDKVAVVDKGPLLQEALESERRLGLSCSGSGKAAAKPHPSSDNAAVLAQLRLDLQQAREALALKTKTDEQESQKVKGLVSATGDKLVECGTQSRIVYVGNDGQMYATCKGTADEIFRAPPPAPVPAPHVVVVQPANIHQLGGVAVVSQTTPTPTIQPQPLNYPCKVVDKNKKVLADFLDKNANPYGLVAKTDIQCKEARERFIQENRYIFLY